jgi:hypothetical protein
MPRTRPSRKPAVVDAGAAECASRVRLPGVRRSAAGGRYHCGRSRQVREDVTKRTGTCGPDPLRLCENRRRTSFQAGPSLSTNLLRTHPPRVRLRPNALLVRPPSAPRHAARRPRQAGPQFLSSLDRSYTARGRRDRSTRETIQPLRRQTSQLTEAPYTRPAGPDDPISELRGV